MGAVLPLLMILERNRVLPKTCEKANMDRAIQYIKKWCFINFIATFNKYVNADLHSRIENACCGDVLYLSFFYRPTSLLSRLHEIAIRFQSPGKDSSVLPPSIASTWEEILDAKRDSTPGRFYSTNRALRYIW